MNEFERLIAFFKISTENLAALHHNVGGRGFFEAHEVLQKQYEYVQQQVDALAEIGIRLGYAEPSIADAVLAFQSEILPVVGRNQEQTYVEAQAILRALAGMCMNAEAETPADVVNRLQEIEYELNHQANYLLARALIKD